MDTPTSNSCDNSNSCPKFDFSTWSPEASSGLSYISLLPFHQGYAANMDKNDAPGKSKVSTKQRKTRMDVTAGRTVGKDLREERKLKQAIESGDLTLASALLQSGVDPSCCDDKQRTPLHLAAAKGNEQFVNLLLDSGANPNMKDAIGNTPLHLAACTSQIKVVTLLLKAGTDVNAIDQTGRTPLHLATGRLRLLQSSSVYSNDQLKQEVNNIINMMKEYLMRSDHKPNLEELDDITEKLQSSCTKVEIDELGGLLSNFASLQLSKPCSSSTHSSPQMLTLPTSQRDPPSPAVYNNPR